MVRIKRIKNYNIYSDLNSAYIIHNIKKEFKDGHTHINNYNTAKYIIYLSMYKRIPKKHHLSLYLIDSVIRISDDKKYIEKMNAFKKEMILNK